jgi:hypothetical protein
MFSEYLFHPHTLPALMTGYKDSNLTDNQLKELEELQAKTNLTEKQSQKMEELLEKQSRPIGLSDTAKSAIIDVYLDKKEGRKKIITNKFTIKGNEQEDLSIAVYASFTQKWIKKNEKVYKNDWLEGTPDVVLEDKILEIKTKFDRFTFAKTDKTKALEQYYWQVQGYLLLTNKQQAELVLTCVDSDDFTIYNEVKKEAYVQGIDFDSQAYQELENQIRHNHTYNDLQVEEKLKIIPIDRNEEDINRLKTQINRARSFLSSYQPHNY